MSENEQTVYNVKINGEQRKAFDAIALKTYLENQKFRYSVLSINPMELRNDESLAQYVAKAAIETLKELEIAIDEVLGLTGQSQESTEESDEVEEADPKPKEKIKIDDSKDIDESDEEITL